MIVAPVLRPIFAAVVAALLAAPAHAARAADTTQHFLGDRESQVEFVPDAAGKVGGIRVLWNDGWIDSIARAK